jgi:hypothetical protein
MILDFGLGEDRQRYETMIVSRQVAKTPSFRKFLASYFVPFRPFDVAQDMLCGRYSDSFGCSVAALCLSGEYFFTVNP